MASSFAHQVAGHAGTLQVSASGATVTKPSTARERDWYLTLAPSLNEDFVGTWTPAFYGTLKLAGEVDDDGNVKPTQGKALEEAIVLENLTHKFKTPNVMDIKLGTILYDDEAPPEKVERMKAAAANTTSGSTGIRITGFQTWEPAKGSYEVVPKQYGKALKADHLLEGMWRFFPRERVPAHVLAPVAAYYLSRIQALRDVFATMPVRIRASSLLFVYEGDPEALEAALENAKRSAEQDEEESEASSDEDAEGNAKPSRRIPCIIRMIDFAHASRVPDEEGPDEGILLGMDTTIRLLTSIVDELAELA